MRFKPRLFVFSHICSLTYITGAEKLLLFMLRELKPYFECTLVVPNVGYLSERAQEAGIAILIQPIPISVPLYLSLPHLTQEINEFRAQSDYRSLVQMLAERRPDFVLASTSVHPLPAIAAKELGIPVVWMLMETIRTTPHTPEAVGTIVQHADWIVGISESTLQPIRANAPQAAGRLLLQPPSWHLDELRPQSWHANRESMRNRLAIGPHQRLIGFVASSIYENKGFIPFMEMAVQIAAQYPNAFFLIVGNPVDRPLFDNGMAVARDSGMIDRFRWIRFEASIETIYPALDLLVVPSMTAEGFGLTAMEGLVFRKPVVSFAAGGLGEIMASTGNGAFAVPIGDVAALAGQVSSLLSSPSEMQAIGERNGYAVERIFGLTAYRIRLKRLIDMLMAVPSVSMPKLLRGSEATVYLLENGVLRPFASEKALIEAGYSTADVMQVDDATIRALPLGEMIGLPEPPLDLPPPQPPAPSRSQSARRSGRRRIAKGKGAKRRRAGTRTRQRRSSTRQGRKGARSRTRARRRK